MNRVKFVGLDVLALARDGVMATCPRQQFPKSSARKLAVFPHAKASLRCPEPVTSNIECAPHPVRKQFRQFYFLFWGHDFSFSGRRGLCVM